MLQILTIVSFNFLINIRLHCLYYWYVVIFLDSIIMFWCVDISYHSTSSTTKILYHILIIDSSSPSRMSLLMSHLTNWFQTLFLVTRHSHFHVRSSSTHRYGLIQSVSLWGYFLRFFQHAECHGHRWFVGGEWFVMKTFSTPCHLNLTTLQLYSEIFGESVYASPTWVQATSRVDVKEDCQ